jgi:hypothetical protein
MRNVSDKRYTENQNTHFTFNNLFLPKIVPFMRKCNIYIYICIYIYITLSQIYGTDRQATDDNIIPCKRFACWITNATNTHSEYLIRITSPRQQWLRERAPLLHYTYIACLVVLSSGLCLGLLKWPGPSHPPHTCYMSRPCHHLPTHIAQMSAARDRQVAPLSCHLLTSGVARGFDFSEANCFIGGFRRVKTGTRTHKRLKKDSFFSVGDMACGTRAAPHGSRVPSSYKATRVAHFNYSYN